MYNILVVDDDREIVGAIEIYLKKEGYNIIKAYNGNEALEKVKEKLPNTPIVLHGASTVIPEYVEMCNKYGGNMPGAKGVPDEMLHEASMRGVSKINVDTDLRLAMTAAIRKVFAETPEQFDPRKYMGPGRELIEETVKHKIRDVFGSSNKA